jgi:hypothetical protein
MTGYAGGSLSCPDRVPLAQRMQMTFMDDLDGSEAAGTVRFGLAGAEYEIDLSAANAEKLGKAIEPYIAAGRKVRGTMPRRASRASAGSGGPNPAAAPQRAKDQGIAVKDKGRVPDELVVRFRAAGQQTRKR